MSNFRRNLITNKIDYYITEINYNDINSWRKGYYNNTNLTHNDSSNDTFAASRYCTSEKYETIRVIPEKNYNVYLTFNPEILNYNVIQLGFRLIKNDGTIGNLFVAFNNTEEFKTVNFADALMVKLFVYNVTDTSWVNWHNTLIDSTFNMKIVEA